MYVFPLPLVGPQPDALLFGVGDQLVPELGVGDGDELLRPLPGAAAHQVHAAVFGDDVVGQTPGIGDDIAGSQQRVDAGHHLPLLVGKRGRQTDEGLAALGHGGALQEVQLAAGAADLPGAGALGAYLAVQVHGDAVVDGHKVVDLPHDRVGLSFLNTSFQVPFIPSGSVNTYSFSTITSLAPGTFLKRIFSSILSCISIINSVNSYTRIFICIILF